MIAECDPQNQDGVICEPDKDKRARFYSDIEIDMYVTKQAVDFSSNDPGILASNNGTE